MTPRAAGKSVKASRGVDAVHWTQVPNIGPSISADLRSLGYVKPSEIRGRDPRALYDALCRKTGQRQDPCVLDTFMAAVDFMNGGKPKPWWEFTAKRKALTGSGEKRRTKR